MPERLSYRLIGACYDIYNKLGYGHKERIYQNAMAQWLTDQSLPFKRELSCKLTYSGKVIRQYRLDFLVDNKIALEFKVAQNLHKRFLNQLLNYLVETKKTLGICVIFTSEGVIIKRVANGEVTNL